MRKSSLMSLVEASANVVVGLLLSVVHLSLKLHLDGPARCMDPWSTPEGVDARRSSLRKPCPMTDAEAHPRPPAPPLCCSGCLADRGACRPPS
jgi:hypothetical protein